ncbi:MAG: serine/threonine-protein kinase [Verrucomicrobiales bacterium]|nr:serine/threonine-protein kinase [Verrucomicrobiales bacterium]
MADRYEIKGRLGRGGIGAVYQAFDHHLGRDVAIKRLLPMEETRLNDSAENSLASEAKALASLSHPNIVTIFEFGEDDQGPFVVFELIEGDTLKDLISEGALSESDFYEVADQILDALIAAHKMNLLHRDIKPANIMLSWLPSGKFQIKMLDFGLAKFAQEPSTQTLDQKGSFLGSIDYIAPEQIELFPLDQRTDLYSLGCVLYFSLTQKPPFNGSSMAETMNNHLAGKVVALENLRPDIPIAVCRWVMSLISLHPSERPNDALTALQSFIRAKKLTNESLTDSIPTAKLVVPVVATAQPVTQPRVLEDTRQIVSSPSPMTPVVPRPSGPSSGDSKLITGRYQPKPKPEPVSRKAIFGLVGSLAILIIVAGFVIAGDRRERKRIEEKERLALEAEQRRVVKPAPAKPQIQKGSPVSSSALPMYESRRSAKLPQLPSPGTNFAYYSVNGELQNREGEPYDFDSPGETLGAISNAAQGINKFHLLKRTEDDKMVPSIVTKQEGQRTIVFNSGQKLSLTAQSARRQEITSSQFTFAMIVSLPANASGSIFRFSVNDANGEFLAKPIRTVFINNRLRAIVSDTENAASLVLPAKQYRAVIIEIDADKDTLSLYQRSREGRQVLPGDKVVPLKLDGPLRLSNYEFGNLMFPKRASQRRAVEMPAIAIYSSILTPVQKNQMVDALFKAIEKP